MWRLGLALLVIIICSLRNGVRGEKDVPESCEGLMNIGKADVLDCEPATDCLSETCNVTDVITGHGATLLLFPCDKPPALQILLNSPAGSDSVGKFDSRNPSRTTGVPLGDDGGFEFQINVEWPTPRTASLSAAIVGNGHKSTLLHPTNVTIPACKPTKGENGTKPPLNESPVPSSAPLQLIPWQLAFLSALLPPLYSQI